MPMGSGDSAGRMEFDREDIVTDSIFSVLSAPVITINEKKEANHDNSGTPDKTLRRVYGSKRSVLRDRGRACIRVSWAERCMNL